MNVELFLIGFLMVLLLGSNIYWARVNYGLINRLMSRDFQEFQHGKRILSIKTEKAAPLQPLQDEAIDPDSERQAQELNTLFNMA